MIPNALQQLLKGLPSEEKRALEDFLFEGLNDSFFKRIPAEDFFSILNYWFHVSEDVIERLSSVNDASQGYVSLHAYLKKLNEIVVKLVQTKLRGVPGKQSKSHKSLSLALTEYFFVRHSRCSESASKLEVLIRLITFLVVRRAQKISKSASLEELKNRASNFLAVLDLSHLDEQKSKDYLAAKDVYGLLECLSGRYKTNKDITFLSKHASALFFEGVPLSAKKTIEGGQNQSFLENPGGDASAADERVLFSNESAEKLVEGLAKEGINKKEKTSKNACLSQYCSLDSLTSRKTLEPKSLDFQRKPEFALNLPTTNYTLLNEEKECIVATILRDLVGIDNLRIALIVALKMLTSSNFKRLASFVVSTNNRNDVINLLCLKEKCWKRQSLILPKSYQTSVEQSKWLHEHDDFLYLPLPETIIDALARLIRQRNIGDAQIGSGVPLYDLLGFDVENTNEAVNHYLNQIKHSLGFGFKELTKKSIRYALFAEVTKNADVVLASLLFANAEFCNQSSLYYLSASEGMLQEAYKEAASSLGFRFSTPMASRNVFVGSRICVDSEELRKVLVARTQSLQKALSKNCVTTEQAIERHNMFASCVCLAFTIVCASRGQANYFFDYASIDEASGYFLVCDKYHYGSSAVRFLPLTELLQTLLTQYRMQLRITSYSLKDDYPDLARRLYSLYSSGLSIEVQKCKLTEIPLLGLIKEGRWMAISSRDLKYFLSDDFSLPKNFMRHLLCSHLPLHLARYRQLLLGHINQGQDTFDDAATNVDWFSNPALREGLDSLLKRFGFIELKPQSLRGAFSLEPLPTSKMYYPIGYLEREAHYRRTYHFAKKHFLRLFKTEPSLNNIGTLIERLPCTESDTHIDRVFLKKVERLYRSWAATFDKTKSKKTVRGMIYRHDPDTIISLRHVEYAKVVRLLQRHFLDYLSLAETESSKTECFFLSLFLFQPRIAEQILSFGRDISFSVFKVANTLILKTNVHEGVVYSAPLNWLSSYLLFPLRKSGKYTFSRSSVKSGMKAWLSNLPEYAQKQITHFSTLSGLVKFVSLYGVFTQVRASAATLQDNVKAGDYSIEDIGRILSSGQGHYYTADNSDLDISSYIKQRRFLPQSDEFNNASFELGNEERFIRKLLSKLNAVKSTDTAVNTEKLIREEWAMFIGSNNTEIEHLTYSSVGCSEFLVLWLFYGIKVSRRKSSGNSNNKVKAGTVHKYMNAVYRHLYHSVAEGGFLLLDEEDYTELYSSAVKKSTYEDKGQLLFILKDYHQVINDTFVIDEPEWMSINFLSLKKSHIQGIARLLTIADYEQARSYFKNKLGSSGNENLFKQHEHDMHAVVLALAYRLGLRKREIRFLLAKHINLELGILTVTGTRHNATKSNNSPRRLSIRFLFDDEEWQCLTRLVNEAKKSENLNSPCYLFGSGILEERIAVFEQVVANCMGICRILMGNPKLRFYDLRHTHINYRVMIISRLYRDRRYETALAKWGRVNASELDDFRQLMLRHLIGSQIEIGGVAYYGLASQMGHSPKTEREYYLHCLHLVDDVMVNDTISDLISGTKLFDILKKEFKDGQAGFRAEQSVRRAIKNIEHSFSLSKKRVTLRELPTVKSVLTSQFRFEIQLKALAKCLSQCWLAKGDIKRQQMLVSSSLINKTVWSALMAHAEQTGYRGIYIPRCFTEYHPFYAETRVNSAVGLFNMSYFESLLTNVVNAFAKNADELGILVSLYSQNQYDNEVIIPETERDRLVSSLMIFDKIIVDFEDAPNPSPRRRRNVNYVKLLLKRPDSKRKTINEKFNLLISMVSAILNGCSITSN